MRIAGSWIAVSVTAIGLLLAANVLAAVPEAGTFSGGTSQATGQVEFTVPAGGASVLGFAAELTATCTKQGAPDQAVEVSLTPKPSIVIRDGGFSYGGHFSFYNPDSEPIGHGQGIVSGTFTSTRSVTGSMRFPWTFGANAGLLSRYHCDTERVAFQASTPAPSSPTSGTGASPGQCTVPKLKGKRLKAAKRAIRHANCKVGRVVRRHSRHVKPRRIVTQKPGVGTRLSAGSRVKLIVSSGPPR
jgi:PASTA domain